MFTIMFENTSILYLCIILFQLLNVCAIDGNVWRHQLWLDPNERYSIKWDINSDNQSITFLCEVRARGWIGFGISPNGGMAGSDLVIGWVDDSTGITYFNVKTIFKKIKYLK